MLAGISEKTSLLPAFLSQGRRGVDSHRLILASKMEASPSGTVRISVKVGASFEALAHPSKMINLKYEYGRSEGGTLQTSRILQLYIARGHKNTPDMGNLSCIWKNL